MNLMEKILKKIKALRRVRKNFGIILSKAFKRVGVFLSCHMRVQSESTLCNSLNVKELLARSRHDI